MSQEFNSGQVSELQATYLARNDVVNRWGNLTASYMALPGLRFFAPMSVVGASGEARDLVLGNDLANNNAAQFSSGVPGLVPWCQYNGSTQYHNIADNAAHDIIGNEGYIGGTVRGLSMTMWVRVIATASNSRYFVKGASTGNVRAYSLRQNNADQFIFDVSDNGTNVFAANDTSTIVTAQWYFLAGRFNPSTEVKLWVGTASGLTTFVNVTGIPATINNSAVGLGIGAQADGTLFSNIRASMCAICVEQLSDAHVFSLFEQGRVLYGLT